MRPAPRLLICVQAGIMAAALGQNTNLTPVVYTGQVVQGLPPDFYSSPGFDTFSISPSNHVTFKTNRSVVRVSGDGKVTTVVADPILNPVVDLPSQLQGDYYVVIGNSSDTVSFSSIGTGFGGTGVVSAGSPASPHVIAREHTPVDGNPGLTHKGSFMRLSQGVGGHTTFVGDTTTASSSTRMLWSWSPTSSGLRAALTDDQPIVPTLPNVKADLFTNQPYSFSSVNGTIATSTWLKGSDVGSFSNFATVRGTPGSMAIIARRGERVTHDSNMTWNIPAAQSISPNGHIGMRGEVYVDGLSGAKDSIWIAPPEQPPQFLVRAGTLFPPGPGSDGLLVSRFIVGPAVNDNGQYLSAAITSNNQGGRVGIITGSTFGSKTLMVSGAQIPGQPLGTTLLIDSDHPLRTPALNDDGYIAVRAYYYDPQLMSTRVGLWLADQDGRIDLISCSGQSIELAAGDARTIADIFLPRNFGSPDDSGNAFGSGGCLVFETLFTDGTTALITTIVPAPSVAIAPLMCVALFVRRRRA